MTYVIGFSFILLFLLIKNVEMDAMTTEVATLASDPLISSPDRHRQDLGCF